MALRITTAQSMCGLNRNKYQFEHLTEHNTILEKNENICLCQNRRATGQFKQMHCICSSIKQENENQQTIAIDNNSNNKLIVEKNRKHLIGIKFIYFTLLNERAIFNNKIIFN